MASFSASAASEANRSRSSERSASRVNASIMKACGLLCAFSASRSMRRLRSSGSFKLVAVMTETAADRGSHKVVLEGSAVKARGSGGVKRDASRPRSRRAGDSPACRTPAPPAAGGHRRAQPGRRSAPRFSCQYSRDKRRLTVSSSARGAASRQPLARTCIPSIDPDGASRRGSTEHWDDVRRNRPGRAKEESQWPQRLRLLRTILSTAAPVI